MSMKKFLAFAVTIVFVGLLALSLIAYAEDDPKKQNSEKATSEQCDHHTEKAEGKTEAKACCQESADKAPAGCQKSSACEHESEAAADAK